MRLFATAGGVPPLPRRCENEEMIMNQRLQSQVGITLMELMVTTVIIGLVAGMAVPRFQKAYKRLEFRGNIQHVNSFLRLARSQAISQKERVGVYFDEQSMAMTMFKDRVNPDAYDFVPGDSVLDVDTLSSDIVYLNIDTQNKAIVFKPNGSAGFSGGGNISILSLTQDVIGIGLINVLASTGRVANQSWAY
ncbi:MAG: hypothetical protein D6800_08410 [Candidatus Zixiibacteriota bacterium]|nr:MAG: hypothetical protein D6800_08410 [candidate division Zixibacteria bacterium]